MSERIPVLCVDANATRRDRTATALEEADDRLVVETVGDPDAGVERLGQGDVACVVSEHRPPNLDGLAFLAAVREKRPEIPFVLFAGAGSESVASEATSLDVTEYLLREAGEGTLATRILEAVSRHRAEREERAALREDSQLLDAIFEQLPVHLLVKDEEARNVRVSRYFVTGDSETYYEDALEGWEDGVEALLGRTDLDLYPEEFARETYADDVQVIETGEPIIDKEEYVTFLDEWNLTSKVPWRGPDGEVKGLLGISRRITTRKTYEEALERQNTRLERFASVVSHDLRNPLNVAGGNLELERTRRDGENEHLDAAATAVERCEAIIDDVLTLMRRGDTVQETETISLESFVREAWETVVTAEATLVVEDDLSLDADPGRVRHLFENLFRNAIEHGGDDVTVRVGALADVDGFFVADDGDGIPTEEPERVFETGFSTSDDGTGFGLSIVEEMASAHGWGVVATESRDGGMRFEITGIDGLRTIAELED